MRSRPSPGLRFPLRRTLAAALFAGCVLSGAGCTVHEHTIGLGPSGLGTESARQFYLLYGLFRLNDVDAERMAGNSTSFRVRTESAPLDYLLMPLLLPFSIRTRTVTVTR